jgi:hypothetical protein
VAAARRVQGLYTVPVVDADLRADEPWPATAYVPGPSLHDAVDEYGPLPVDAAMGLIARVAEGLRSVHSAEVICRDLKDPVRPRQDHLALRCEPLVLPPAAHDRHTQLVFQAPDRRGQRRLGDAAGGRRADEVPFAGGGDQWRRPPHQSADDQPRVSSSS